MAYQIWVFTPLLFAVCGNDFVVPLAILPRGRGRRGMVGLAAEGKGGAGGIPVPAMAAARAFALRRAAFTSASAVSAKERWR